MQSPGGHNPTPRRLRWLAVAFATIAVAALAGVAVNWFIGFMSCRPVTGSAIPDDVYGTATEPDGFGCDVVFLRVDGTSYVASERPADLRVPLGLLAGGAAIAAVVTTITVRRIDETEELVQ